MNEILAPTEGQPIETISPAAKLYTVLSPVGTPPKVTKMTAAPRLESLDGKTIYLVDCRFDDSIELLKEVAAWFATHMPAVTTHAITLETTYGVPTIALHTDKFDKVVASVAKVAGLPEAPRAFVPQPVMGKTAAELAAYVNGNDPITGRPVMQEIVGALVTALDGARYDDHGGR